MKKNIPLNILPNVQALAAENMDLIEVDYSYGSVFYFKDSDPSSNFYFRAIEQTEDGMYSVQLKPQSIANNRQQVINVDAIQLLSNLTAWFKTLRIYAETPTIFDDPFAKKYGDFFFKDFEIVDEDRHYAPFDIPRQFLLADQMEQVKHFINDNEELFNNGDQVKELLKECDEIVEDLPSTTKSMFVKRVSGLVSKIMKTGMTMSKKFITTFATEFPKKLTEMSAEKLIDIAIKSFDS